MLGAVVVLLQAEAGLGFDLDALDLESAAFVYAVLPAPRAVHFAVQGVLFAICALQLGNDVLHILAARFVGHQDGVCGFDDNQVVNAHQADQAAVGVHQVVVAVGAQHIAHMGIAL